MNPQQLQDTVARAVHQEWPAFTMDHPRLAELLSEEMVTIGLARSIQDDPEYRAAMTTAAEIGAGADVVTDVVTRLVHRMIRTLL